MVKRFLLNVFLGFLSISAFSAEIALSEFGYLNDNLSAVVIGREEASAILNVDVTPGGRSIKKRSGFGLSKALGTGQAVHGGYHFFDSSGADVQVWGSSTSLISLISGVQTTLISSATLNATWDCTDNQGTAYCVNSSRDALIATNGTTQTWYSTPLGTMATSLPSRLVVAGVSGNANTLYFSAAGNFVNFTTGLASDSAFTEVVSAPGSKLIHIQNACGKLLWWKDQSFGWMIPDDQFNIATQIVSDSIGTLDNTSAIDPGGNVWFHGQDGHIWRYDCAGLQKMTIPISPNIQTSGHRINNSWTQTSAADFGNGLGYATFVDTISTPGTIELGRIEEEFDSVPSNWTSSAGTWTSNGDALIGPNVTSTLTGIKQPVNSNFYLNSGLILRQDVFSGPMCCVGVVNSSSQGYWACLHTPGPAPSPYYLSITTSPSTANTLASHQAYFNTGTFVVDGQSHSLQLYRSATGYMTVAWDNGAISTTTVKNNISGIDRAGIFSFPTVTLGGQRIGSILVRSSTGTYYSAVYNAPNLTSWGSFTASDVLTNGSTSWYVRSATNSFTTDSSTPAWTVQLNGNLPTASTGTYFQARVDYSITAAGHNPQTNDFTFRWNEGTADQAYMQHFDNSIWTSVAFGSGQATNNYIFKYDLINEGWTLYNFGANGMLVQSNVLFFGDPSAGNVFKYGTGTSDNGSNITAYWRSKNFTGPDPWLQNEFKNLDSYWTKNEAQTSSVTYTLDGLGTSTSYTVNLSSATKNTIVNTKLLPAGKMGQMINVQFGDTSNTGAWEMLGFRLGFTTLPWRPTQ